MKGFNFKKLGGNKISFKKVIKPLGLTKPKQFKLKKDFKSKNNFLVIDRHTGNKAAGPFKTKKRARTKVDKLDNAYGAYRYGVKADETSKNATMYRGVDDSEFFNLKKEGKLKPHGSRNAIWITPSKAIASRYNKNILSLDVPDEKIVKVPGRSKMFLTNEEVPLEKIKKVESYPDLLVNDKPVEEKWHSIEPIENDDLLDFDDMETIYVDEDNKGELK